MNEPEKKGKKDEIKYTPVSIYYDNDVMWEIIYDGAATHFIAWDGKEFIYEDFFSVSDNETIIPICDDSVKKGNVVLPEKPEPFESIEALVNEIKEHIHEYCDISDDFETFAAYYVLLSWIYDKLDTIPYLRVRGDTGTGKSRVMKVVGRLLYKSTRIAGAVTPAPIYRLLDMWKGSMLIEEADWDKSDEKNEVITILNCGFEKDNSVVRCNKDHPDKLQFFNTFSPKIIATRQAFTDKALESRCITEIMKETTRKDILVRLPEKFYEEQKILRNKLLYFRLTQFDNIKVDKTENIELGDNIEPRLKQAVTDFAILFKNIPEVFESFKIFIRKYQNDLIEERSSSFDGQIIKALFELEEISELSQIAEHKECSTSSNNIAQKMKDYGYEKLTAASIGKRLKSLGLTTKFKKIDSSRGQRNILWDKDLMINLYLRYIPIYIESKEDVKYQESAKSGYMGDQPMSALGSADERNNNILVLTPNSTDTSDTPDTNSKNDKTTTITTNSENIYKNDTTLSGNQNLKDFPLAQKHLLSNQK